MRYSIVLAMEAAYYLKAITNHTFDSLAAHWPHRICLLCIGFAPDNHPLPPDCEVVSCKLEDLPTYAAHWPTNRPHFVCAEGGDFLNYFNFDPDEILIHLDADIVMQRKITADEMETLAQICQHNIASTLSSYPPTSLSTEASRLRPISPNEPANFSTTDPIFCTGFIATTAYIYRQVIYQNYLRMFPGYRERFNHHATGQLIFNVIARQALNVNTHILPGYWSCAKWFRHNGEITVQNNLLHWNDQLVIFNHNKFDPPHGY